MKKGLLLGALLFVATAAIAFAATSATVLSTVPSAGGTEYRVPANGGVGQITEYGQCRVFTNNDSADLHVPANSQSEWNDILANPPTGVTVAACTSTPISGCTNPNATNYDPAATVDDGSCTLPTTVVRGCTDSSANNYNPSATVGDGSCTYTIYGCIDSSATNYDPSANTDDRSCTYPVYGCGKPSANNYNPDVTIDNGSCTYNNIGCMDPSANNYDPSANVMGSCSYTYGCTDSNATNYNSSAVRDDGLCSYPPPANIVWGCTDPAATNYYPAANTDNGSCWYYGGSVGVPVFVPGPLCNDQCDAEGDHPDFGGDSL